NHEVRTLDLGSRANGSPPTITGDPRDREVAAEAVRDCDVVIHLAPAVGDYPTELDVLDAATRGTYNLITTATDATRFILLSSLRPFERYPADWWVTESWAPWPTTDVADLAPYLAELTVREASRVQPLKAIGLRLGEVVDDQTMHGQPIDPRWLHLDDAVQAVERALVFEPPEDRPKNGWWEFHIVGAGTRTRFPLALAGQEAFGYAPRHDLVGDRPTATAPIERPGPAQFTEQPAGGARKVGIGGAGGPLAAITTEALVSD